MSKYYYADGAIHHDHHKEMTINVSDKIDITALMKVVMAEDPNEMMVPQEERVIKPSNPRSGGRRKESLFKSKSGGKNEELTKAKASDFTNYLKEQGLIDTVIDTSRENEVNKAFVNFYIKWIAEENIAPQPNGNACFRFLKEDCALEMASNESGYIKTYGDFIRKMISEEV